MTTRVDPEGAQYGRASRSPSQERGVGVRCVVGRPGFGRAVALNDRGLYPWREFRDTLVAVIAKAGATEDETPYYGRFLTALEQLAIANGMVSEEALDARTAEFAAAGEDEDEDDHDGYEHVGSGPHVQRS